MTVSFKTGDGIEFVEQETVTIPWGISPNDPNEVRYRAIGSATITEVDIETNTIYFSTPIPEGVTAGTRIRRK